LLVKQDAYTGEKAKSLKAAEDGKVVLANGEAPKTVELASIQQIIKPKPVVEDLVWKGNVDLALDYKRAEKDTDDYDIDFKTTARHGRWRHTARANTTASSGRRHHHRQLGPEYASTASSPTMVLAGAPDLQARQG
jgi:hypothetical protein